MWSKASGKTVRGLQAHPVCKRNLQNKGPGCQTHRRPHPQSRRISSNKAVKSRRNAPPRPTAPPNPPSRTSKKTINDHLLLITVTVCMSSVVMIATSTRSSGTSPSYSLPGLPKAPNHSRWFSVPLDNRINLVSIRPIGLMQFLHCAVKEFFGEYTTSGLFLRQNFRRSDQTYGQDCSFAVRGMGTNHQVQATRIMPAWLHAHDEQERPVMHRIRRLNTTSSAGFCG